MWHADHSLPVGQALCQLGERNMVMVGMSSEGDLHAQFTSEVSDFVVIYNSYTHAQTHACIRTHTHHFP